MVNFGDIAVKAGKAVIRFIAHQIMNYLKSEEFKKQMKKMISTMVERVIAIVLAEKVNGAS